MEMDYTMQMGEPINYESPRPKPSALWLPILVLLVGCLVVMLGCLLAVIARTALGQGLNDPAFSWGPGGYVYHVLRSTVYVSLVSIPLGTTLVLVGWRRLRSRRSS
jgi:hypothetical protein